MKGGKDEGDSPQSSHKLFFCRKTTLFSNTRPYDHMYYKRNSIRNKFVKLLHIYRKRGNSGKGFQKPPYMFAFFRSPSFPFLSTPFVINYVCKLLKFSASPHPLFSLPPLFRELLNDTCWLGRRRGKGEKWVPPFFVPVLL